MPRFSRRSKRILSTCRPELRKIANEVVKYFDITVIDGRRDKERQNEYYRTGKSKVQWPDSAHNVESVGELSRAFDIGPWVPGRGVPWDDHQLFHYMAGRVMQVADSFGIKLRWGGDWDMDQRVDDETWRDLAHFELDE